MRYAKVLFYREVVQVFLFVGIACCLVGVSPLWGADVIIENNASRLVLDSKGFARSLRDKASGEELLLSGVQLPFATLTQDRPYDNEYKLMLPAKPWTHRANRIERQGDELRIGFEDEFDVVVLKIEEKPLYIGFSLVRIEYDAPDFGNKRKTEIDGLSVLRLPVRRRAHFGSTLNVTWNDTVAVSLLAADVETCADAETEMNNGLVFWVGTEPRTGLKKLSAALVTTPCKDFLNAIDTFERDYNLPRGVESRRQPDIASSAYFALSISPKNLDYHLSIAREGGFGLFMFDLMDLVKTTGTYALKDHYPNGLADLTMLGNRIRAAGLRVALHGYPTKVDIKDPLATTNLDPRLNVACTLLLAQDVSADATTLLVEGNAGLLRPEKDRHLVALGRELITYDSVQRDTASGKVRLTGCTRGVRHTPVLAHGKGTRIYHLDLDDWPIWIRLDPYTTIQAELADRIAEIWKALGCVMFYFDGAEDVPPPYWHHVPRAQQVVYDRLDPKPLYCESALKSHFGWHINSRGNAFDVFAPERIEAAMRACNLRCAALDVDNFTCVDFGWLNMRCPQKDLKPTVANKVNLGIGMQPDHFDYVFSKAVAWNSPVTLQGDCNVLKRHPRLHDNLASIARWEQFRRTRKLSEAQRASLRDPGKWHALLNFGGPQCELVAYHRVTADSARPLRAFSFTHNGKAGIVYWDMFSPMTPVLDLRACPVECREDGGRRILLSSVPEAELVRAFRHAIPKP